MKECVIIVPVYQAAMTEDEKASLKQVTERLGGNDICLVCPTDLDLGEYKRINGNLLEKRFSNTYFENREQYCKMLTSPWFYESFSDYEYMLIYQLDAWVFGDSKALHNWCEAGYDYIGAPFFVKWFLDRGRNVGNGGFSLRKISSMINYLKTNVNPQLPHFGTDDGFFAANYGDMLKIPTAAVAKSFSLEQFPEEQYREMNAVPFGCHAFRKYNWVFWKQFINLPDEKIEGITFCILNYKDTDNAKKWYNTFKNVFNTYIIDTYVIDNGGVNPYTEYGEDSHIRLEHNVYNGGQRIIAYNLMCENDDKWLMTVDADVIFNDNEYAQFLSSIKEVISRDDIGVYECSATPGSKCMGSTQIIPDNIHLYKQTEGLRTVEGAEGWFRLTKKDICDRIYPYCNFEDNKYGWGTGEAYYYLAKQMGLKTVIDDRVALTHPDGLSYDNRPAVEEREKFMARFDELGITTPYYKTASELKTLVCCIGKNENRYIREYVDWYKKIGVSHICLYDNNDLDGERFEDIIQSDIDEGFVNVVDYRGRGVCQLQAYKECYENNKNDYDWILFIDCGDEYFETRFGDINNYLAMPQFRNYDIIHVNLMTIGDNDAVEYEDRPLAERFPNPIPFDTKVAYNFPEDCHVSSIVRGGLDNIRWDGDGFTHTPSPTNYRCCNNVGFATVADSPFAPVDFQFAAFRHYTTKTAQEYCDKMRRGFPDQEWDGSRVQNLIETRFFRTNKTTKEKIEIFKKELGVDMSYLLPAEEEEVEKNKDVQIYSLCFSKKDFKFLNDKVITPLQVGAANGTEVCKTKDNTGENISPYNYFFVENTGTFWIWRNIHDAKYKGQMQYRRPLKGIDENTDFDEIFKNYDVITCEPFHHPDHKVPTAEEPAFIPADTVEQGYAFSNCIDDLWILEMVVKKNYPEYTEDWDKYITNGPDLYYSNGFILKAEDFNRYAEFSFMCLNEYLNLAQIHNEKDLMDHVKYNIEVGKYIRYKDTTKVPQQAIKWQTEIGGFLSERLWTLWVQHNFPQERIYKTPYIKMEEGMYT